MPASPVRAFIGLGANLGQREAALSGALAALRATPGVGQVEASPLYETAPVGPPQPDYLNAVAGLTTTLPARSLLARLLEIEQRAGRERDPAERHAPRTLDLDLLLYGDSVIEEPGLSVPHPRMQQRAFVLTPLAALAPRVRHPVSGRTARELCDAVAPSADVRPFSTEEDAWPS